MEQLGTINALVQLVDDPDENIYQHIRKEIKSYGVDIIPILESSWNDFSMDIIFHQRVENLIQEIQFEETQKKIKTWISEDKKDLIEGLTIITQYQYPEVTSDYFKEKIKQISNAFWLEINERMTIFEKIKTLNKLFFHELKFSSDRTSILSPFNSYINEVLSTKKGNALSLSIIYSLVAQQNGLPIYCVKLPNHFIVACLDKNNILSKLDQSNKSGILCYINPYDDGKLILEQDIKHFLDALKIPHKKSYFEPCSNSEILIRLLNNLIISYQAINNKKKVEDLLILRNMFS